MKFFQTFTKAFLIVICLGLLGMGVVEGIQSFQSRPVDTAFCRVYGVEDSVMVVPTTIGNITTTQIIPTEDRTLLQATTQALPGVVKRSEISPDALQTLHAWCSTLEFETTQRFDSIVYDLSFGVRPDN